MSGFKYVQNGQIFTAKITIFKILKVIRFQLTLKNAD